MAQLHYPSFSLALAYYMAIADILPPTDLSYLNNRHIQVISCDPHWVAGEHDFTQRACFYQPCICKALAVVGVVHSDVLFSSDRTSKESACCFTAEAPQGAWTSGRHGLYLFLCQLVFLPSSWQPPLHPHLFLLPRPLSSHTISESPQLSTHSVILPFTQNLWSWCLAHRVCHLYGLCPGSASLSAPGLATHESLESAIRVEPDVPPQVSQWVKPPPPAPPHSSLAD